MNTVRRTDVYAKSSTKVPHQIYKNRPDRETRYRSTEATGHFDKIPCQQLDGKNKTKDPLQGGPTFCYAH